MGCNNLSKKWWGFIKDPVFGYVHINDLEKEVIDTQPVQRLRRIKQLAGTDYVYPGANHTRFEHAIGSMFLAGRLADNLSSLLSPEDIQELRLASLLHDVGHGPFSHVFEPLLMKYMNKTHEDMTTWLIQHSELKDLLKELGFDTKRLGRLAVGKLNEVKRPFLDQFLRSAVDVDKMDFLVRDSYHTGAEYSVDVFRLIYTLDIFNGNLSVNLTALHTLEAFIIARVESFKSVYFHKTARAAQLMMVQALEAAKDECGLVNIKNPLDYLNLDDYTTWTALKNCSASNSIISALEKRKLLKSAYEQIFYTQEEFISNIFVNDTVRQEIESEIAQKAGVPVEDVFIDVPLVSSVPYRHSIQLEPMEIPIFMETRDGKKISRRLNDLSKIINLMKGFMNILRVYTKEQYRDKVSKAAIETLGEPPYSAKISL
ncbi:MAG: HD domain-containing protein [Promethearchaeota archaeon]